MKVNIIFYLSEFVMGGAGNSIFKLCKRLPKNKFNISIICLNKCYYKANFEKLNIKVFEIKSKRNIYAFKKIKEIVKKLISNNYKSFYAYKLCANADLVIAKHTSLADECLTKEIPVLFHEYTHNLTKMVSVIFNYSSSELMCSNFEELLERSKSLLFDSSSKLKNEIAALNKTIYHVKERGNIKNKIILDCMRIIQNG